MVEKLKFTTVTTRHIEAIVGKEEMELAAFHDGRYNPEEFVLISITNPGEEEDLSSMHGQFKNHLHVSFSDVREITEQYGKIYHPISENEAQEILHFILQNKGQKFFIHCEYGVSRSAGVGIALESILEYHGDTSKFDLEENFISDFWRYTPNEFVTHSIMKQFSILQK